jgi:hypothetical protein
MLTSGYKSFQQGKESSDISNLIDLILLLFNNAFFLSVGGHPKKTILFKRKDTCFQFGFLQPHRHRH